MDNGTLIYIILTILFFVINALTKKKKEKGQEGEEMEELPADEQPKRKRTSFEELLQEIRQEQQQREEDFEITGQKEVEEKEKNLQPSTNKRSEEILEPEKRKPEIKYYEGTYQAEHPKPGQKLVKLEDMVDIDADEKILKEVEDVSEEISSQNRYRRIFRNPETLKDAVVVSEILNRKHF